MLVTKLTGFTASRHVDPIQGKKTVAVSFRESLEREESQRLQQASVEAQISSLRQSLEDQSSAAESATAGLEAQLEGLQRQIAEVTRHTPWFFF